MFKIHTKDGQTVRVDLADAEQAREWLPKLSRDEDFQAAISGISIVEHHDTKSVCTECGAKSTATLGVQYSITRPQDFARLSFRAEHVLPAGRIRGGDRVTLYADDLRLVVMAHASQPSVRLTLSKPGKHKFLPPLR